MQTPAPSSPPPASARPSSPLLLSPMLSQSLAAVVTAFAVGALLARTTDASSLSSSPPPGEGHHPNMPRLLHPRYRSHLHCPHAARWLDVGPEAASAELGMRGHVDDGRGRLLLLRDEKARRRERERRRTDTTTTEKTRMLLSSSSSSFSDEPMMGRCIYANVFSGGDACAQYHGSAWTEDGMRTRCDGEGGVLSIAASGSGGCPPDGLAGWCVVDVDDVRIVSTIMTISPASDCEGNEMACETFVGGTFVPDGDCASPDDSGTDDATTTAATANDDGAALAAIVSEPIMGSCTHGYDISEGTTCLEFRGVGWTAKTMSDRCDGKTDGTYRGGGTGCADVVAGSSSVAGWCDLIVEDGGMHETTMMTITDGADCEENERVCESFLGGTFGADGACASASASASASDAATASSPSTGGGDDDDDDEYAGRCLLAPGAIGAAHQAGYSKGYSPACPNTPGEGSPYMWPMAWSADVESKNMAYGSDEIVHTSRGRTYYMLDRNWKRSDTTYREGLLRTIGQGPCDDVDEDFAEETGGLLGCRYNDTDGTVSTMIHRENLMYFISWKDADVGGGGEGPVLPGETDASRIEGCEYIDLVVIGNIRPDWFLDKRGDDTDVQYLGNQHVYYSANDTSAVPRLVKQWRKKDFASQYFTMSMMGNPPNKLGQHANASAEEGMHWPLILNVPGEGFGDDFLQVYRDHRLLDPEADAGLFELIENYEALGGVCVDLRSADATADGGDGDGDGAQIGPPVLEEGEKIPSNLEVDPMSWFTNEYTFSPVWDASSSSSSMSAVTDEIPPASASTSHSSSSGPTIEVSDRLAVESCADGAGSVRVAFHFRDVEPGADGLLPWMAIGYRASDICAMTPPDGGPTPMVLLLHTDAGVAPVAHKTLLLPEAKGASDQAFATMTSSMKSLSEEGGEYSDVLVTSAASSSSSAEVSRSSQSSPGEVMDGTVSLRFKHTPVDASAAAGSVMYYTYAIGTTSLLGFHETRGCFEVPAAPCGDGMPVDGGGLDGGANEEEVEEEKEEGVASDLVGGGEAASAVVAAPASSSNDAALARGAVFVLSAIVAALIGW